MSQADYAKMQELEVEMRKVLAEAMTSGDPAGPLAQKLLPCIKVADYGLGPIQQEDMPA